MQAEIVSVGTELLLGQTTDTNATELGRAFASLGIDHFRRQTVGDNLARLTEALTLALNRSDLVVTIGGLGPTEDDLTRDGIAAALGLPLVEDEAVVSHLKRLFRTRGLAWTESQRRQAQRPEGADAIINPNGTAPALWCPLGSKVVVALPGPPSEFNPLVEKQVLPRLVRTLGGNPLFSRLLRVVGVGEAAAEEKLRDLLAGQTYTLAPYAKLGEVHFRVSVKAADLVQAKPVLDQAEREIRLRLGRAVYGTDGQDFETTLIHLLHGRNLTLGVAESCTGGGLGSRLTNAEGASNVFMGGFLTYQNAVKVAQLGVDPDMLNDPEHGAVSEECARQMALGCQAKLGCDIAISVTGVAGVAEYVENGVPKPNGLVYVGLATPQGVRVQRHQWGGNRPTVRGRAVQAALIQLYHWLVPEEENPTPETNRPIPG